MSGIDSGPKTSLRCLSALVTACTFAISCSLSVAADSTVRIPGEIPVYYPTLQAAIDGTGQGDLIQAQKIVFNEHVIFNRDLQVQLTGGYDSGFGGISGRSVIRGDLRIGAGTLRVRALAISRDATSPAVVSVSPGSLPNGIPVNCTVSVTFDEPISAASTTAGTITLKDSENHSIPGTLSTSGRTLSFTPSSPLKGSTSYRVALAPGVKDLAGNATTTGHAWQFLTSYGSASFDYAITPLAARFTAGREESANQTLVEVDVKSAATFPVALTVEGCPPAAACVVSPREVFSYSYGVEQTVALLVSASSATPVRPFTVIIRGDGGGVMRSATLTVDVAPFRGETRPAALWGDSGTPVVTAAGNQMRSMAVGDGAGGAIFLWDDDRSSVNVPDLYAQRIGAGGTALWQTDGNVMAAALDVYGDQASQSDLVAIPDGAGGAVVTWKDERNRQGDIFAQRVDSSGIALWEKDGAAVCTACWLAGPPCANHKQEPQIVADNVGGSIITWYETRDGLHGSVWAQRMTAQGLPVWQKDGVAVAYGDFNARSARIVSDGAGGSIIVWQDDRPEPAGYRAQRLDPGGVPLWTVNGLLVPGPAGAASSLKGFATIADGAGGVIVAWVGAAKGGAPRIYAQKLDQAGNAQWGQGVALCTATSSQYAPSMVTDGAGGAIVAWEDQRLGFGIGQQWIYAQLVGQDGKTKWSAEGLPVYTFHGSGPQVASDDAGGAIIVWDGLRLTASPSVIAPAIYAQHVAADGRPLWTPNGYQIFSIEGSYGMGPRIIGDGQGGAIIQWTDYRLTSGNRWDIFGQRLTDKAQ